MTVKPIISAYRRMIRDLEFDVAELAPVTYVMAREAGIPLIAIPVFINRKFHHSDIVCGPKSGIRAPKDLEGKEVGVRAFSVSTGVWGRGLLAEQYGVDIESITWVVDDDDHIQGKEPANQRRVTDDRSLESLLLADELGAAFSGNAGTGRAGAPREGWTETAPADTEEAASYPLFPDAKVLERDWFLRTGVYPLHSVIVIRSELAERAPELPTELYAALVRSKQKYLAEDPTWAQQPRLARQAAQVGGDPVPYGAEPNQPSIDALVRYSAEQGLISNRPTALFAPGDYPVG
ncbi:PhnD/SsuA/transferrin family substrate-binding protein [Flexivirga alba]|uniref:PhnD/SsuA/transferrin family substrate-binding protein n=1 Tax=Flexivirga alba TaxID=702742 RepID=A0ABW2ADA8_9MICO